MTKLTGLIAAPHTPFDANGEVNYPVIDRVAEHLIRQALKALTSVGQPEKVSTVLLKSVKKSPSAGSRQARDSSASRCTRGRSASPMRWS